MNFRREGNESSGVHAYDPLLETELSKIVVEYKYPLCRHVMVVREVGKALHSGHDQLLCSDCLAQAESGNGTRFFARDNELQDCEGRDIPESCFDRSCNFPLPNVLLRSLGDETQESGHQMSLNDGLNDGSSFPNTEPVNSAIETINEPWQQETFVYPREADEQLSRQSSEVSPPSSEMHPFEENRSCQRSTHQHAERGQENGLLDHMASDVTLDETSFFAREVNLPPDSTEVRDERQLLEPYAGDEALVVSYPIQGQLIMETPVQRTYHQEDYALHNGLSSPTQETVVHDAPPPPPPPDGIMGYPVQESEQDVRGSYLVQESSELRLGSGYDDRLRCAQQTNHYQVNGVSSFGETEQAIEYSCNRQELRLWEGKIARAKPQKAMKKINAREAFFITEITEVRQHRHVDTNGGTTAVFTCPIKTDRYGYKLGLRMYLNGVGNGRGRYVAIFMHMMMGKYDNFELRWPFTQRITLSIIDQSGAQRHLSRILQAKPNMVAFEKPTQAISRMGCGFVNFGPIEEVFSHPYVKDDKLFLKIEFSA